MNLVAPTPAPAPAYFVEVQTLKDYLKGLSIETLKKYAIAAEDWEREKDAELLLFGLGLYCHTLLGTSL